MGALVLGMREGEKFYIDQTPVTVEKITSPHKFTVSVSTDWASNNYQVSSDCRVEILPNVFCSAGSSRSNHDAVRILIEAPREMKILRAVHFEANNATDK